MIAITLIAWSLHHWNGKVRAEKFAQANQLKHQTDLLMATGHLDQAQAVCRICSRSSRLPLAADAADGRRRAPGTGCATAPADGGDGKRERKAADCHRPDTVAGHQQSASGGSRFVRFSRDFDAN